MNPLFRHPRYQYFTFSCTKNNHFLLQFMYLPTFLYLPSWVLQAFSQEPHCRKEELNSPFSAISHSHLITKESAKKRSFKTFKENSKNVVFFVHHGNVFISAWLKIVSDKSESHRFWKTHKKKAKKSIAASLNLILCLPSYRLLLPASRTCSYLSSFCRKVPTKIKERTEEKAVRPLTPSLSGSSIGKWTRQFSHFHQKTQLPTHINK